MFLLYLGYIKVLDSWIGFKMTYKTIMKWNVGCISCMFISCNCILFMRFYHLWVILSYEIQLFVRTLMCCRDTWCVVETLESWNMFGIMLESFSSKQSVKEQKCWKFHIWQVKTKDYISESCKIKYWFHSGHIAKIGCVL